MRPEALAFLRGSVLIIHAGDIGGGEVLEALRALAPLVAVRGNNDTGASAGASASGLRESEFVWAGGALIYVVHDLGDLDADPQADHVRVIVSGHSHKPLTMERDGVMYINPGSAGRRRFRLPVALGELIIEDGAVRSRIVTFAAGVFGGEPRASHESR